MFRPQIFDSMDEVQLAIFDYVLASGIRTKPRGMETLECAPVSFTLLSPRKRCISNPQRNWSLPLALGELAWHLSASDKVSSLAYYAPIWNSFADENGRITGSCYGAKIFSKGPTKSQWSEVRSILRKDPDTRRAILYFSDPNTSFGSRDVACAISLQFLLRSGKLDAIVNMRSNDAVWGLPYDVFLFSFLQEMMAVELGTELGHYHHLVASMHIYDRHVALCRRVLEHPFFLHDSAMQPMENLEEIQEFLALETAIRNARPAQVGNLAPFWRGLLQVLYTFKESREDSPPSSLRTKALSGIYQNT
jgi:thymidylate synthase